VAASAAAQVVDSSVSTIVPRAAALDEDFKKLPGKIYELVASATLNKELLEVKTRLSAHKVKLGELKASGLYSFDKISELRTSVKESQQNVDKIQQKITNRIKEIEQLRQAWEANKSSWSALQKSQNSDSEAVKTIFKEIDQKLNKALKMLDGVESPLVQLQKGASETAAEFQDLTKEIDNNIAAMRKDLFRKSRPAMFTPSFVKQFDKSLWEEFWIGVASLNLPDSRFYSSQGWVLSLQLLGILLFIWLFSTINLEKARQISLDFLIERKFSAALFAGIALFYPLFEDLPNIARVFLWTLMCVGGARVLASVVQTPWRRRLIYLLSALFLFSQFAYLVNLPSPIYRIYVALVGLLGAIVCFWRVRLSKDPEMTLPFVIAAKIGGLTMLVIFVAQAAGFAGLGNHLLEVAIKTVFFLLSAWIIAVILRGIAEALLDNVYVKRSQIFKKHSSHIIKRVKFVINIVAIYLTLAGLMPIWGLQDSFAESAYNIMALGFYLQGERITIGVMVTAIALLYLSIFASWMVQRILDEEVYPRKRVESGVGISINRLIHYAFVTIGAVIAMSTIGIGLQSLAVLMGAFGIGIGFGLQNIVNNFASGLILLFERSIKVGDVVQVAGIWGKIKNLGLRATVVETFDHSELIVPNSDLVSTTVTNWTLSDRQIRIILKVGVAYGSDVKLVTSILHSVARENPFVMKFPEPSVLFMGFGNSSLDFELRVFVSDIDNMLSLRSEINQEIDRQFREHNVEIPFPQNDLHIRTMDEPFKESIRQLTGKTIADPDQPSAD
jgi:small-conductance mechanosensitive channel